MGFRRKLAVKRGKAVSQLVASIILIALAIVGGLVAFAIWNNFANTEAQKAQVNFEYLALYKSLGEPKAVFAATLKNAGNKPIKLLTVKLHNESAYQVPSVSESAPLEPGRSVGVTLTPPAIHADWYVVGNRYVVIVMAAQATDGSTFSHTTTVMCMGQDRPESRAAMASVTFSANGLGPDVSDFVLTLDGADFRYPDLPITRTWPVGSVHQFEWRQIISGGADKKYVYLGCSTSGSSSVAWQGSGTGQVQVVEGHTLISANYTSQYTLAVMIFGEGKVDCDGLEIPESTVIWETASETVDLVAVPDLFNYFEKWVIDGDERTENPIIIIMDRPHVVEAHFKLGSLAILSALTNYAPNGRIGAGYQQSAFRDRQGIIWQFYYSDASKKLNYSLTADGVRWTLPRTVPFSRPENIIDSEGVPFSIYYDRASETVHVCWVSVDYQARGVAGWTGWEWIYWKSPLGHVYYMRGRVNYTSYDIDWEGAECVTTSLWDPWYPQTSALEILDDLKAEWDVYFVNPTIIVDAAGRPVILVQRAYYGEDHWWFQPYVYVAHEPKTFYSWMRGSIITYRWTGYAPFGRSIWFSDGPLKVGLAKDDAGRVFVVTQQPIGTQNVYSWNRVALEAVDRFTEGFEAFNSADYEVVLINGNFSASPSAAYSGSFGGSFYAWRGAIVVNPNYVYYDGYSYLVRDIGEAKSLTVSFMFRIDNFTVSGEGTHGLIRIEDPNGNAICGVDLVYYSWLSSDNGVFGWYGLGDVEGRHYGNGKQIVAGLWYNITLSLTLTNNQDMTGGQIESMEVFVSGGGISNQLIFRALNKRTRSTSIGHVKIGLLPGSAAPVWAPYEDMGISIDNIVVYSPAVLPQFYYVDLPDYGFSQFGVGGSPPTAFLLYPTDAGLALTRQVLIDGTWGEPASFTLARPTPEHDAATMAVCQSGREVQAYWIDGNTRRDVLRFSAGRIADVLHSGTDMTNLNCWGDGVDRVLTVRLSDGSFIVEGYPSRRWPTRTLAISVNDPSIGSTDPQPGLHSYRLGDAVSVTGVPADGYGLAYWVLDGVVMTGNPICITMDKAHTLTAVFAPFSNVTFSCDIGADVANVPVFNLDGVDYYYDQMPKTFTCPIGSPHTFQWYSPVYTTEQGKAYFWVSTSGLVSSRSGAFSFPSEGGCINASYVVKYRLTISVFEGRGTTDPAPGTYWYEAGTTVNITAIPAPGWRFDGWTLIGEEARCDNPLAIEMNAAHDLRALFALLELPRMYVSTEVSPDQSGYNAFVMWFYVKHVEGETPVFNYTMMRPAGAYGESWEKFYAIASVSPANDTHCRLSMTREFEWYEDPVTVEVPLNTWVELKLEFGYSDLQPYMCWYYDSGEGEIQAAFLQGWSVAFSSHVAFGCEGRVLYSADIRIDHVSFTGAESWTKGFEVPLSEEWNKYESVSRAPDVVHSGNYALKLQYPSEGVPGEIATVTFEASGLPADATGTVLTIDGELSLTLADLPKVFEWEVGSVHEYEYAATVPIRGGVSFALDEVVGPPSPMTITCCFRVTGKYVLSEVVSGEPLRNGGFEGVFFDPETRLYYPYYWSCHDAFIVDWDPHGGTYEMYLPDAYQPEDGLISFVEQKLATPVPVSDIRLFTFWVRSDHGDRFYLMLTYADGTVDFITDTAFSVGSNWAQVNLKKYLLPDKALSKIRVIGTGAMFLDDFTMVVSEEPITVTVTFRADGLGDDCEGVILNIDGYSFTCDDLPLTCEWEIGDEHQFEYAEEVRSTTEGKYYVRDWVSTSSPLIVAEEVTVTAHYEARYEVMFSATGVGSDAVGPILEVDGVEYYPDDLPARFLWSSGSSHTFEWLSPVAADSKRYAWVSAEGLSTERSGVITVPERGESVVAHYKTQYLLCVVVSPSGAGTVSADPPSPDGYYDAGTTVQLAASAAPGYAFDVWAGGASGAESTVSVVMDAPKDIIAKFFTFSVSLSQSSGAVVQGESTTVTVTVTYVCGESPKVVSLSASGLPPDAFASFDPSSVEVDPLSGVATSTLIITTSGSTPRGTYLISIIGLSEGVTKSSTYSLTVSSGLLTLIAKYVVASTVPVQTDSRSLTDDPEAVVTFVLDSNKTVLVIYQASNLYGDMMNCAGMQNAINVDGSDVAISWDSGFDYDYPVRNVVFWVGTLPPGSHTIAGRFASNEGGWPVTVSSRVLIVAIFSGSEFYYVDDDRPATTTRDTFTNDPYARITVTPSAGCKALVLYNAASAPRSGEGYAGKKIAIKIGESYYAPAGKSPSWSGFPSSAFTAYALHLEPAATTIEGVFATNVLNTAAVISRRQFAVLLLTDSASLDVLYSETMVSTTSSELVDDPEATITRATTDDMEALIIAVATKRAGTSSSGYGECYGINVDGNDRTSSRGSPGSSNFANSVAVVYAERLPAGEHTIKGRFSNNYGSATAVITSRVIIVLWFPSA